MNGRKPPLKSFLVDMWAETAEVVNSDGEGVTFSDSVMHVDDLTFNESAFQVLKVATDGLPAGSIVHHNIVEAYKQDLSPEDQKKITIVASPADSLRSVYPVVNNSGQEVESILDRGSQIVAMDLAVAVGVGLHWDPDTVIHMQSANGLLKKTRGLARNVPFTFGDLTIYLQVHNYADGYQELTLRCPNTMHRATVGTYPRGEGKKIRPRGGEPTLRKVEHPPPPTTSEEAEGKEASHAVSTSSEEMPNFQ
ncbi:hypothetical protein L218DRAFT_1006404 [Marasmius fiardii PR-910]|nr:hypothetical protein L218DRAFT_1006404 [Marasmius fiardii PR-910]